MSLTLITPPVMEPVSLAELKEHLRVDIGDTSQDNDIATLGMAGRAWVEAYTRRRCVAQTYRLLRDFFPGYYARLVGQPGSSVVLTGPALLAGIRFAIDLDFSPVQSIVDFQYINAANQTTALSPSTGYLADLNSSPARLTPPFGQMWPVALVILNAVQVDYLVGYANPVLVSSTNNPTVIQSNYLFQATDVGRPISIPGAGANGGTLNTVIAEIGSPPGTILRDPILGGVQEAPALLVNNPNANPAHWEMLKAGIKCWVTANYDRRMGPVDLSRAKLVLSPVRDLRP